MTENRYCRGGAKKRAKGESAKGDNIIQTGKKESPTKGGDGLKGKVRATSGRPSGETRKDTNEEDQR